ncbi:MAG: hypothetical protein CVU78_03905 [Elusimicrobia bacterium HGW-Elusimicrobia-2]|nr:MAG: hypothetical protein CVU78_03905 [Elusimicrobia bacterium HGW-Elusimicrobia-2]
MKTLLKFLAFAAIAVTAFFAFFPFGRITEEINSAVSRRIAESGADLRWGSIETDFIRTVTLNDVVLITHNEYIKTLHFKRVTLYFPVLFILRKGVSPGKIGVEDSEISIVSSDISKLFPVSPKATADIALPSLFFRRVRVTLKDLRRAFVFGGRIDDGHLRAHIRSGNFSASSRADREAPGLWKMQSSVKNMDFFSVFLSTPRLSGENFSGTMRAALGGGKILDMEMSGVVTADSAVFPGISFFAGEVFELKDFKSVFSLSKETAEFSGVSAECGQLRLRGGMKVSSLGNEPLSEASFRISGRLDRDDILFEGGDALVSLEGFLKAPVFRIKGSAESFKKGALELKQLSVAASFNDRNSRRFSIESFDAKYGDLDINGKGGIASGVFFIKGRIRGVFNSGASFLKLDAPYELGKDFRAYPAVAAFFYGRELKLKGDILYSVDTGTAVVKLDNISGENVLRAKFSKKNGDFVLEEAILTPSAASVAAPARKDSAVFRNGLIKNFPGGFSFVSSFLPDMSFLRDSSKCSLSYSRGKLDVSFEGAKNFLKYGQLPARGKTAFTLEGKTAQTGFKAEGKYGSGDLKGSLTAGDFSTDFSVSGGTAALTNMIFGQYASGELTLSKSISGKLFVKDYPLRIKALKKDEKLSAIVKIKDGGFEAEISGEKFSQKISGTLRASGLSALNISIPDSEIPISPSGVRQNSLSGEFNLIMSGIRPKEVVVSHALIRAGDGRVEFFDVSWQMERRAARGRVQIRNIKKGPADIFANSVFEIDHSSGLRLKGKAKDVFINAFYTPFEYDILISSDKTVFSRPNAVANGLEGVLTSSGGAWEIFTGGSHISALWQPPGIWKLKTQSMDLQKILKLLNSDIEAFGDVQMEFDASAKGYKFSFAAPDIYIGTKVGAAGSVTFDGDFFYPDVRINTPEGFIQTGGYIAASAGQVNKASIIADNVKIPVIQTSFGEIRNFSASGSIFAGGTYEMPRIEGKIMSGFRAKHRDYPETVDFSLNAVSRGGKIIMYSTSSVKGVNFTLTGEALLASGGLKNYGIDLYLPGKGVPVVVPGLLIERKKVFKYILGTAPSYGKISGNLSLADDGENASIKGLLKIKDARFSYRPDSLKTSRGALPDMDVTLVFDRNVEWISDKFKADIYGSINIKGAPYEVNGKISSSRGRLTYLGKNLDIDFAEIDIVKNKIFITLQAEAEVSRKNPNPPFEVIADTIRVDIRHSPLESLDINLASKDFSDKTSGEQAYQMITGVPSAAPGDLEFMKKEMAKVIDTSIINPFFSEIVRGTGIVDDVRLDVSALAARADSGNKLDGLNAADKMNLYMGKSFGRMYFGYNVEMMKDISSLQLFSGFEIIYRIRGNNILRAVYQPDESGDSRKYLGLERRIRF